MDKSIESLSEKREEFRREKKTGASLATEALEFYNVVLKMNQSWKGSNIKSNPTPTRKSSSMGKRINHTEEDDEEEEEEDQVEDNTPHDKATNTTMMTPSKEESKKNSDLTRSKRQRRQPVLFDPQTCPASAWVDESTLIRTKGKSIAPPSIPPQTSTTHDPLGWILDKDPKVMKKVKSFIEGKREEYNISHESECKFCMSKEDIIVCCFCACRVCFVKDDKDYGSIKCDICNADFHTNCLVPTLNPLPSGEWYCPSCIVLIKSALDENSMIQRKERKRITPTVPLQVHETSTEAAVVVPVPVKRGPGRPRKNENIQLPVATDSMSESRPKRKRIEERTEETYRPFKKTRTGEGATKSDRSQAVRLLQIIPGTNQNGKVSSAKLEEAANTVSIIDVDLPLESPQRSRSGRLLKRNNFYHQKEEGDPNLKSSSRLNSDDTEIGTDNNSSTDQPIRKPPDTGLKDFDPSVLSENRSMEINTLDEKLQGGLLSDMYKSDSCNEGSKLDKDAASSQMDSSLVMDNKKPRAAAVTKAPRRKPGARECMQISRRFGVNVIPQKYMDILLVREKDLKQ